MTCICRNLCSIFWIICFYKATKKMRHMMYLLTFVVDWLMGWLIIYHSDKHRYSIYMCSTRSMSSHIRLIFLFDIMKERMLYICLTWSTFKWQTSRHDMQLMQLYSGCQLDEPQLLWQPPEEYICDMIVEMLCIWNVFCYILLEIKLLLPQKRSLFPI